MPGVQETAVLAEELIGHAKRLRARRRLIFTLRSWAVLAQEQAAARAQAQSLANRHACSRSDCALHARTGSTWQGCNSVGVSDYGRFYDEASHACSS